MGLKITLVGYLLCTIASVLLAIFIDPIFWFASVTLILGIAAIINLMLY